MIAIMNIGKYSASHSAGGEVSVEVKSVGNIGIRPNCVAFNEDKSIYVAVEYNNNVYAVSTDGGNSWHTYISDYSIGNVYFSKTNSKFYLLEYSNNPSIHYATSNDGKSFSWIELYKSETDADLYGISIFEMDEDVVFDVLYLYKATKLLETKPVIVCRIFESDISNLIVVGETDKVGSSTFYRVENVKSLYKNSNVIVATLDVRTTTSGSPLTQTYLTFGVWGIAENDGWSIYMERENEGKSWMPTNVYSDKFAYLYPSNNIAWYSDTAKKDSHTRFPLGYSQMLGYLNIGNWWYAYSKDKIARAYTLSELMPLTEDDYHPCSDMTTICNAFEIDSEKMIFVTADGKIYLCKVK